MTEASATTEAAENKSNKILSFNDGVDIESQVHQGESAQVIRQKYFEEKSSQGSDDLKTTEISSSLAREYPFNLTRSNPPGHAPSQSPPLAVIQGIKAPKDTLQAVYKAGEYKAGLTLNLLAIQSFMAGVYIAMAGHLFLACEGGVLGSAFFPTGLIAVVLTSGELFTGDALVFIASVLGGRVPISKMARNWTVSWIMNFAGAVVWAAAMSYGSGAIEDKGLRELAVNVAVKKAFQPWSHIFLKGVGANFMVCLGIWQAMCAEEAAGKILAIWFPITAFVIMGFEHCIANQFFLALGMLFGADISITRMLFQALLPATLGNIVGGGVFMGAVYWYVFDTMAGNIQIFTSIRRGLNRQSVFSRQRRTTVLESTDADEEKSA